jgi:hypothetical protein
MKGILHLSLSLSKENDRENLEGIRVVEGVVERRQKAVSNYAFAAVK